METVFDHDPELLRGFREGRREALEKVYWAYARRMDRYLRSLARAAGEPVVAQPSAIGDLLQEVFIRAFSPSARRGFDGLRNFGPYLAAIARNCFVDAVRSSGREVLKSPEELALVIDGDAADPSEDRCDRRTLDVVIAFVRELPDELRGVYEQRFVLGRSQEEASAALGLSRRAVRTREGRLRKGLRKALIHARIWPREIEDGPNDSVTRISASTVTERGRP